jgi:hypothetical protein
VAVLELLQWKAVDAGAELLARRLCQTLTALLSMLAPAAMAAQEDGDDDEASGAGSSARRALFDTSTHPGHQPCVWPVLQRLARAEHGLGLLLILGPRAHLAFLFAFLFAFLWRSY